MAPPVPFLKCPHCKFKTVHQVSMDNHLKHTHIRNHPSPPNVQLPNMCEKDIMDWEDAMKNRSKRRSLDMGLECLCRANPMNWDTRGKKCTCKKDWYACEAHPRTNKKCDGDDPPT